MLLWMRRRNSILDSSQGEGIKHSTSPFSIVAIPFRGVTTYSYDDTRTSTTPTSPTSPTLHWYASTRIPVGVMPFTTVTGTNTTTTTTATHSQDVTAPDDPNNNQGDLKVKSDDDEDDDDNDDDDDDNFSDLGESYPEKRLKSSKLKKLYKGKLKKILLDDHGMTVDAKGMNWIIPWKMAVLIHCLETKQDYSIILKRPGPKQKEIERYLAQRGIRDTKENKLRARLEMKRHNKIAAKQLLLQVMVERGHVMKHPPSTKSEWQDLYIRIQEMVVQTSSKPDDIMTTTTPDER